MGLFDELRTVVDQATVDLQAGVNRTLSEASGRAITGAQTAAANTVFAKAQAQGGVSWLENSVFGKRLKELYVTDFLQRHKTKLIWGLVIVGGLFLLPRLLRSK